MSFWRIYRVFKCLTWRRALNFLRAASCHCLALFGIAPDVRHKPVFLSVEPANTCNLRCPQCAIGNGMTQPKPGMMTEEMLQKILDETGDTLLEMTFFFQGEPLINKNLPQLIGMAHQCGIYTLCSTNAQLLTERRADELVRSGLDRLIISMDGHIQESYGQYRVGGDVQRVYDALRFVSEAKKRLGSRTPEVELQCLLLRSTEDSIAFLQSNYRDMGADTLTLKTAQFYDYEHGDPLMPTDERMSRYARQKDGTYRLKGRLWRHCWRMVAGAVIDANGSVRPCCFDKMPQHAYGNIAEHTLLECWWGQRAQAFRKAVMAHRENIDICQNCTNV